MEMGDSGLSSITGLPTILYIQTMVATNLMKLGVQISDQLLRDDG